MRRRAAKSGTEFSLFPFLAVLLCTMGSLIVLLLVLVQRARVEASETAQPEAVAEVDAGELLLRKRRAEEEAEKISAMAKQLADIRSAMQQKLQTSSLTLSHLEDHIRRLRQQLAQLEADYQVLKQAHQEDSSSHQQQRAELARLQQQIQTAAAELEAAQRNAAAKPRSYSIVPYDGPRGTRRRPIYLECRRDQLIIHPEGHILLPSDLQDGGPGNPLAATLRATREYFSENSGLQGGEPYPLLLVRPDGAKTFAAAMNAMKSWTSEYGYELIDAEMQLELPPADEALGDVVRRTIRLARERQLALAELRARNLGIGRGRGGAFGVGTRSSSGGGYLAASRNGGFELQGGSRGGDDWLDSHVTRPGSAPSQASSEFSRGARGGFYATEQETGETGSPHDPSPHQPGGTASRTGTTDRTGAAANVTGSPGGQQGMQADGQAGPSLGRQQGGDANAAQGNVQPMAGSRGANWALPSSSRGATPFNRPVRVVVSADQLTVLPDRGEVGEPRVTQLSGPMRNSIDGFVAHLWEHMNGWGVAGTQAYWKPILSVEVTRGGEKRFAELAALMQQSGVEVEWKR